MTLCSQRTDITHVCLYESSSPTNNPAAWTLQPTRSTLDSTWVLYDRLCWLFGSRCTQTSCSLVRPQGEHQRRQCRINGMRQSRLAVVCYAVRKWDRISSFSETFALFPQSLGPWHLGLSPEACEYAGGQYVRSPCVRWVEEMCIPPPRLGQNFILHVKEWPFCFPDSLTTFNITHTLSLKECIDDRPELGEPGYSNSFEEWVSGTDGSGGFLIQDASDEEQCQNAREFLGFERDYIDDVEVCERFHEHSCDEVNDLIDEQAEAAQKVEAFSHSSYTPWTPPEDAPLTQLPIPAKADFLTPEDCMFLALVPFFCHYLKLLSDLHYLTPLLLCASLYQKY